MPNPNFMKLKNAAQVGDQPMADDQQENTDQNQYTEAIMQAIDLIKAGKAEEAIQVLQNCLTSETPEEASSQGMTKEALKSQLAAALMNKANK